MWKLNDILLSNYGIIPGQVDNEGIAVKGIFDLPKRLGITYKEWDDINSVEPYVAADEIFLEGRNIIFQGILTGTKAETEANIEWLKSDISNFVNIAPFQTPYGSYCVYITKITSKIYNGIATVFIEMREPEVGASCSVSGTVSTYYSNIKTGTTKKNNCLAGYYGSDVTLISEYGKFESNLSQEAADSVAEKWILDKVQFNANKNGTCTINPPIYYNEEITSSLQKNDCAVGYSGSMISHTIAAELYSSDGKDDPTASQSKANAKAQAAMDLILTQSYANSKGTCSLLPTLTETWNNSHSWPIVRSQHFKVGASIITGAIYNLMIYSHKVSYTTVSGDTYSLIVQGLINEINNTTAAQWNDKNSAPLSGTPGFPPVAQKLLFSLNTIKITLDYNHKFYSWITNP